MEMRCTAVIVAALGTFAFCGVACSNVNDGGTVIGADAADATSGGEDTTTAGCHALSKRPRGACCGAGTFFDHETKACQPVGPWGCGQVIPGDAADCLPRWCRVGRDGDGATCALGSDGCDLNGTLCTSESAATSQGCPAGTWPPGALTGQAKPACIAAGLPAQATGTSMDPYGLPKLPPVIHPVGAPNDNSLPSVFDTRFCRDKKTLRVRMCSVVEAGCGPGRMPLPKSQDECTDVGVPWVCPPGFEPDSEAKQQGVLKPCLPDPGYCPEDPFGGVKEAFGTLFVNGKAPLGGNGSKKKPLRKIQDAVDKAKPGAVIAVAAGVYKEAVVLEKPLTIKGRCAHMVTIDGGALAPSVLIKGAQSAGAARIENVTIRGGAPGMDAVGPLRAELVGSWLKQSQGAGAFAQADADLLIENSVVSGHLGGKFGPGTGVTAQYGAKVVIRWTRISGNNEAGIFVTGQGSKVELEQALVDQTLGGGNKLAGGTGLFIAAGAVVKMHSVRLSHNRGFGVHVSDPSSRVEAIGLVVDGTLPQSSSKALGLGIMVELGARVDGHGVRLSGNADAGLRASNLETVIRIDGLLVDGTIPAQHTQREGNGIRIDGGPDVQIYSVRLSGNHTAGLLVRDKATRLDIDGLTIDNTLPDTDQQVSGYGLVAQWGAQAKIVNARLSRNHVVAVQARGKGTVLDLAKALIEGTQSRASDDRFGLGVEAGSGATIHLSDSRVSGNRSAGIYVVSTDTRLVARNVLVDGTLAQKSDKLAGVGVDVREDGSAVLIGCRLTRNHTLGLNARGEGTDVVVLGSLIDRTNGQKSSGRFGLGVQSAFGASMILLGSKVAHNSLAGVLARGDNGTVLHAYGTVVSDTLVDPVHHVGGQGVYITDSATDVQLFSVVARDNHTAGIDLHAGAAKLHDCISIDSKAVEYVGSAPKGTFGKRKSLFADGIVVHEADGTVLRRCAVSGAARAAMLINHSNEVQVEGSYLAHAPMGLVSQHSDVASKTAAFFTVGTPQTSNKGLWLPEKPDLDEMKTSDGPGGL